MVELIKILLVGALVSFLGQLPLGNVNIAATQLSVQEGAKSAWRFAYGLAVVEVIYLRLALTGIHWVVQNQGLFTFFAWLSVGLFLILGFVCLWAARKHDNNQKGLILNNNINRFWLGISISALNPIQIPFWFTWSLYLINSKLLQPLNSQYNLFTIGAGIGSLAGLGLYIYGGKWAIQKVKATNQSLNRFMGIVFIVVAILQLYRLIYAPFIPDLK